MLKTVQLIAQKASATYSCFWKLTLVNFSPKTFSLSEKFWDKMARGKEHDLSTSLKNVQGAVKTKRTNQSDLHCNADSEAPPTDAACDSTWGHADPRSSSESMYDIREDIHILKIKLVFQKRMRHLNSCIPLWIIMIWKNLIANWEKSLRQWNYIRNISMHWTFHL